MSNINNRFNELSAIACAKNLVRTLEDMGKDPSGKRYAKRGKERGALWLELATVAAAQATSLAAPQTQVAADAGPLLALPMAQ